MEVRYVIYMFLICNIITFLVFGYDKLVSPLNKVSLRVSEKRLLAMSLLFGGCGGYLAMILFRHKTNKNSFKIQLPIFAILQLVILGIILLYIK